MPSTDAVPQPPETRKDAMYPPRMTIRELADVWKLGDERVRQFIKEGRLLRGPDGKVDREEAFAFRASALDANQSRALFQTYGNANGSIPSKFIEHMQADRELTADEVIGIEPERSAPTPQEAMTDAVKKQSRLSELRATEMEFKLSAMERKARKEEGALIERRAVHRAGQEAAAEIVAMLNTLAPEVASLISDRDLRAEVRDKVDVVVDKCLFALGRKFKAMTVGADADEDEDDDI